jgi:23S rRNA pseudouridine1911/1915/1917 synthase
MVVHPGAGINSGTLANALVFHFGELKSPGESHRPGIVHRLDVGTSGLIVVAKTDLALQKLSEQFAERRVQKMYSSLVFGIVAGERGTIDEPIGRDPKNRVKMTVRPEGSGRAALTTYIVRERFPAFTRLDVEIKTGRTHQIRVHLAHIKHPVVGDTGYDSGRGRNLTNAPMRGAVQHLGRPFLHASSLSFTHPVSGEAMAFAAELPDELVNFLEKLRKLSA